MWEVVYSLVLFKLNHISLIYLVAVFVPKAGEEAQYPTVWFVCGGATSYSLHTKSAVRPK